MPNSDTSLRSYLEFANQLADVAAQKVMPFFRQNLDIEDKSTPGNSNDASAISTDATGFSPVTVADRQAEQAMRAMIGERFPQHAILGEEYGESAPTNEALQTGAGQTGQWTWVLDPIDGTKSFITGMPTWGILIALNDGTRPVIGVMDQPVTGDRFTGGPDGAFIGETPQKTRLATRSCAALEDAVLFCTDAAMFEYPADRAAFDRVASRVRLTRFGADCFAYCMLAAGLVDLVIEGDLKPYDIQALIPIVEGAGGVITSWDGGSAQHGGLVIAAGDPALHDAARKLLLG